MKEIKPVYYIEYNIENGENRKFFRRVNTNNPNDVPYEKNVFCFKIHQVLDVRAGEEIYHILITEGQKLYAFGKLESLENILSQLRSGVPLNVSERTILSSIKYNNEPLCISPTKNLYINSYDGYIDVDERTYQNAAVAKKESIDLINSKKTWYYEYKKAGSDQIYSKPTFCNDKEFRYEDGIQEFRFVQVAEFEISGQKCQIIVDSEPWQQATKDEVDRSKEVQKAIDGAKLVLYNDGNKNGKNYFNGYTRIYPFNTEDSASVFKMHEKNINGKDVLTVTGSGDALLDLFLYGANNVTCFDCNGLAKYYAKLKFFAVKSGMSFEEYKKFFLAEQVGDYMLNKDIYDSFKDSIDDEETRTFWDALYSYEEKTGLHLANNYEHLLTYQIITMFDNANKSINNPNSYFNEENYQRLQEILKNKSLDDVTFLDESVVDLPDVLQKSDKKFSYMYLSNIIDFTSTYLPGNNVKQRLEIFRDFILKKLAKNLDEDGVIDAGFLAKDWRQINSDTLPLEDYEKIFKEIKGFKVEGLTPYNKQDSILTYDAK